LSGFVQGPLFGGTVGLNLVSRRYHYSPELLVPAEEEFADLFASFRIGEVFLNLFARHSRRLTTHTAVGASVSLALGTRRSASATLEHVDGERRASFTMQGNLPTDEGFGYRSSIDFGPVQRIEAAVLANTSPATFELATAYLDDELAVRGSARGSLGVVGDQLFASRRLGDSFAAVHVPGTEGVRVYADNQLIGRTSSSGTVIIPQLRPYEANVIRIDEADLPLDVQIDRTQVVLRPFAGSGVVASFSPRRERGAVLRLLLEDGSELPPGTRVQLVGEASSHVTVSGGEIYIPNAREQITGTAALEGGTCSFAAELRLTPIRSRASMAWCADRSLKLRSCSKVSAFLAPVVTLF
jgi:outer membrane usher protein